MASPLTYENVDPKVKILAMVGLSLGMMMACMDGTIVGTCGTIIAEDLGGLELYSWLVTAYLLSETGMVPIAGKMSDHFGRKPVFLLGLLLFIGGSVASGLSQSMEVLIVFRAVQGLGGGILMPVAMASVADFFAPEDRGKMQGMLGAVFGIGSGIGPMVGGAICKYFTWHWIFYINVPIALVCFLLTLSKFPSMDVDSVKRIDFPGMVVLTALILDVLLYFQWIGDEIRFLSIESALMIAGAIALLAVFAILERKAEDPIIAPKLLHKRTVVLSGLYLFILGFAMIGTLTFIAMYIITIYGYDTLQCGVALLPMVFGMMFTSMGSGMLVNRTGYRIWVILGSAIIVGSLLLLSTLGSDADINVLYAYMFLFGLGLGCTNSTVMVAVQNCTPSSEMGMTTSAVGVMRNIGSTVGTALYSLLISSKMDSLFSDTVYAPVAEELGLSGTGLLALQYFPPIPGLADKVVEIFGSSVCFAFMVGGLIYVMALVISLFIDKGYTVSEE